MENEETKSTMREFATNDQTDYYSGITSITINGKNAYELKGKFLDDLHNNAFGGTNGEDAAKHIEYFLRIVDPVDLPNVNHDKLRVIVFPTSLVGGARRWFAEIKGSIDSWKLGSDEIKPTNEESSDLKETDDDDEQEIDEIFRIKINLFNYESPLCEEFKEFNYTLKIDSDLFTKDIEGFKTYEDYKDGWIYEWNKDVPWVHEKPWMENGTLEEPKPKDDGYCNGGNLLGAYIIRNSLHYQDYEWYDALKDGELKEEALRNKAVMEGLINDGDELNNEGWRSWDNLDNTNGDHSKWEYDNEDGENEKRKLSDDATRELSVCRIRRFVMIKYSFRDDEKYAAIKEDEYDDFAGTNEEACRAYQEIFRMMDEGWMVTRDE
ncbi:hypothetical protein Tco_0034235 [Tanacetum coccineum]